MIIDAMGDDNAPEEILKGVFAVLRTVKRMLRYVIIYHISQTSFLQVGIGETIIGVENRTMHTAKREEISDLRELPVIE